MIWVPATLKTIKDLVKYLEENNPSVSESIQRYKKGYRLNLQIDGYDLPLYEEIKNIIKEDENIE